MPTGKVPMRLPPLDNMRVRNPHRKNANPCFTAMSTVLACWASVGYNTSACAGVEQALRECMDGPKPPSRGANTINYHLGRMQAQVGSGKKKKGYKP